MARRPAVTQQAKCKQPAPQPDAPMLPPAVAPTRYGGLLDQRHIDRPVDLPERGPASEIATEPQRDRADADTLIKRPELGPEARTFVAAGQLIRLGLEDYDREPA